MVVFLPLVLYDVMTFSLYYFMFMGWIIRFCPYLIYLFLLLKNLYNIILYISYGSVDRL